MYQIVKGIAIIQARKGRPTQYPFKQMEVGDSFFVEFTEEEMKSAKLKSKKQATILSAARVGRYGIKISTRRVENGIRAWRIS